MHRGDVINEKEIISGQREEKRIKGNIHQIVGSVEGLIDTKEPFEVARFSWFTLSWMEQLVSDPIGSATRQAREMTLSFAPTRKPFCHQCGWDAGNHARRSRPRGEFPV
jgi:hypothetical protein